MSTPYIGQIAAFAFGFVPNGWAACNGQILSISTNQALYSLLGTTFGGNGVQTFGLPNLQGMSPAGFGSLPGGSLYTMGQTGGEVSHTLTVSELPSHTHPVAASSASAVGSLSPNIAGNYPAAPSALGYAASANVQLGAGSSPAGSAAHPNQQPYLVLSFCIALQGLYPPRN